MTSRYETRTVDLDLVEGLAERGYNAKLMHNDGWGPDGYYMVVTDAKGRPLRGADGHWVTVWQHWDDPERYEFVKNCVEGRV